MFTRCRSLSAAEEIKVKQNKVERGRSGITRSERCGDKGVWGEERKRGTWRDVDPAGCMWRGTQCVKDALLRCEKCVIKVALMLCCMLLLYTEDVHAQVHITPNILQMLCSRRKPTPPPYLRRVTQLTRNTSMVTNTSTLMSCVTQ